MANAETGSEETTSLLVDGGDAKRDLRSDTQQPLLSSSAAPQITVVTQQAAPNQSPLYQPTIVQRPPHPNDLLANPRAQSEFESPWRALSTLSKFFVALLAVLWLVAVALAPPFGVACVILLLPTVILFRLVCAIRTCCFKHRNLPQNLAGALHARGV